ncbi:GH21161 [Drosophila grimshawi]|uniref:GH21161 n=1 Tax=Drosophila grimshawi TaxID=7222 RepID=B4J6N4_DROGR|nr:GH21161 [Drosophila grimshawi]
MNFSIIFLLLSLFAVALAYERPPYRPRPTFRPYSRLVREAIPVDNTLSVETQQL